MNKISRVVLREEYVHVKNIYRKGDVFNYKATV